MGIFNSSGGNILLYDPNGSYVPSAGKCTPEPGKPCRSSGDFFEKNEFSWDEYRQYHENSDGKEDVHIYEFKVPDTTADAILSKIMMEDTCGGAFSCTTCTIAALKANNNATFRFLNDTMWPRSLNRQLKNKGRQLQ